MNEGGLGVVDLGLGAGLGVMGLFVGARLKEV